MEYLFLVFLQILFRGGICQARVSIGYFNAIEAFTFGGHRNVVQPIKIRV